MIHKSLLFTCKCMVIACGPSLTLHVEHSTRTPRASILILSSSPLLAITHDRFIKLNLKNQVSFYYIYKSFVPSKMSILTNFYPVELLIRGFKVKRSISIMLRKSESFSWCRVFNIKWVIGQTGNTTSSFSRSCWYNTLSAFKILLSLV